MPAGEPAALAIALAAAPPRVLAERLRTAGCGDERDDGDSADTRSRPPPRSDGLTESALLLVPISDACVLVVQGRRMVASYG